MFLQYYCVNLFIFIHTIHTVFVLSILTALIMYTLYFSPLLVYIFFPVCWMHFRLLDLNFYSFRSKQDELQISAFSVMPSLWQGECAFSLYF